MITYYLAWHPEGNVLACLREDYEGSTTKLISLDENMPWQDGTHFWPISFLSQVYKWQILGILGTETIKIKASKVFQGR